MERSEERLVPPTPPREVPKVIPAQIRCVDNLIMRRVGWQSKQLGVDDMTPMHGWILGYLSRHQGEVIYQRDVEREFSITRSTVSSILQLMEKKGYIQRRGVPQDARLKQLVIAPAGLALLDKRHQVFRLTGAYLDGLLTAEENAELMRILAKLRAGLEETAE